MFAPLPKNFPSQGRGRSYQRVLHLHIDDIAFFEAEVRSQVACGQEFCDMQGSIFPAIKPNGFSVKKRRPEKSIAVEVAIQPVEKTLTDEDFEALAGRIVENVRKQTGGVLRG